MREVGKWESGNVRRRERCGIKSSGGKHVIGARLMNDGNGIRHFVCFVGRND